MPAINFEHHTQFFTSTIFQWKQLLKDDAYKQIIIDSLLFLKTEGSIAVNAFVIMPNHLHLIWQIQDGYKADKIQLRFQKYTAQQMKFKLIDTNNKMLNEFFTGSTDRQYQFWKRNPLYIDLWTEEVFIQKLNYIHNNPVKHPWNLVQHPEDYNILQQSFMKPVLMNLDC